MERNQVSLFVFTPFVGFWVKKVFFQLSPPPVTSLSHLDEKEIPASIYNFGTNGLRFIPRVSPYVLGQAKIGQKSPSYIWSKSKKILPLINFTWGVWIISPKVYPPIFEISWGGGRGGKQIWYSGFYGLLFSRQTWLVDCLVQNEYSLECVRCLV